MTFVSLCSFVNGERLAVNGARFSGSGRAKSWGIGPRASCTVDRLLKTHP